MSVDRLIESIRNNDVVLWTGAGFSLYAGMPRVNEIKEAILEACNDEEKEFLSNISDLAEICSEFVQMRNGSRNSLNRILIDLIDKPPSSLKYHQLLTEVPQIQTIVTTNYDRLFEEAYGRKLVPIIENSHIPYAIDGKAKLYKIHGDIGHPNSMMITKDDYTEFFRRKDEPVWNKVKSLLAEKTILFVGYSLSDQNIDFLLDNIISDLGANIKESFLVAPGLPVHKINKLKQKKIEYISMTGEELIEKVHSEVKKN